MLNPPHPMSEAWIYNIPTWTFIAVVTTVYWILRRFRRVASNVFNKRLSLCHRFFTLSVPAVLLMQIHFAPQNYKDFSTYTNILHKKSKISWFCKRKYTKKVPTGCFMRKKDEEDTGAGKGQSYKQKGERVLSFLSLAISLSTFSHY